VRAALAGERASERASECVAAVVGAAAVNTLLSLRPSQMRSQSCAPT